ncbi:DUF58 domain-containing protein [Flindersiella endophytica]
MRPFTPTWKVSSLLVRLSAIAGLALIVAVITSRAELVVVAAPCLAAGVLVAHRRRPPQVAVSATVSEPRCFEDDELDLTVRVASPDPLGGIGAVLHMPHGFEQPDDARRLSYDTKAYTATWKVRPVRWGSWTPGPLRIRLHTPGFGHVGMLDLSMEQVTVFPPPARAKDLTVPPVLLDRFGSHVSRRRGTGTEFAEVRAYAPGDLMRRINWSVSTRRGDLFVNAYHAERSADVIAVVDTTVDVGPWGTSTLDLAVRGAAGVVQAYLQYSDRVGVVSLGGSLRWLGPDIGMRQYYRIVETLLTTRRDDSFLEPELAHLPRKALPPGALVFVFSPLIDPRAVEAVRDVRERGHAVVVIDVLTTEPPTDRSPEGRLALRLWRLEREVLMHGLAEMGVTVLPWGDGGVPLDRVRLEPLLRAAR